MTDGRRGPKRTRQERESDLIFVAQKYVAGWSHFEITAALNSERPYQLSRSMVSRDIGEILRRWQAAYLADVNELKTRELVRLDAVERAAWAAFESSKVEKTATERVEVEDSALAGGELRESYRRNKSVTRSQSKDPDYRYLVQIERCIEARCKILGLIDRRQQVNPSWRKQAEEAGLDPETIVDQLTQEFIAAAQSGKAPPIMGAGS